MTTIPDPTKTHDRLGVFILVIITTGCYFLNAVMTATVSQNLVTFFSIIFGFYMTAIAILYSASYTKKLHEQISEAGDKRGIHILKGYFLKSGYLSLFSIVLIILLGMFSSEDEHGRLLLGINNITISNNISINSEKFLFSISFGVAAMNVFYMVLLLRTIINGMVEESKTEK